MKLKTDNAAKKSLNTKKNKSPKKQAKGVEVRKEKSKVVVKPTVLKKESDKAQVESPIDPQKLLQRELWNKAVVNVSNKAGLSDVENCIVKLLADYKSKNSIPMKNNKFKNFILKGFSKYKDTSDDVLNEIYNKISNEFKIVGGNDKAIADSQVSSKKSDSKIVKTKPTKKTISKELDDGDDDDDDDEEEDENNDEVEDEADDDVEDEADNEVEDDEDILGESDDDIESEEEKPKSKAKGSNKANIKNGKSPNKGKNGKFKGGKVQKKKFGKKN
ncbi:guanine nucleotide-binding protein-like 3 homolog [Sipha flava]|uniref:Guanine nucleotide-binding protein-like 3 homolog n=1 Tax=Sipha flava TaxID=143950 RepID=A0A2S2QZK4_9HEMI|nr:guanine nucleotide-binding protein-like 3 homolog [Sipha flava]